MLIDPMILVKNIWLIRCHSLRLPPTSRYKKYFLYPLIADTKVTPLKKLSNRRFLPQSKSGSGFSEVLYPHYPIVNVYQRVYRKHFKRNIPSQLQPDLQPVQSLYDQHNQYGVEEAIDNANDAGAVIVGEGVEFKVGIRRP